MERKTVEVTEILPCRLTIEELLEVSRDLAKHNQDLAAVEDSKKNVMATFTAQIKKHEADINVCARKISSGEEYRKIKCQWEYDFKDKTKTLYRTDNQDMIRTEELSQDELQENLDLK